MKQLFLLVLGFAGFFHAAAQCPSSGTAISYAWVNPAGTYLDLGSKRPLEGTHHKIFDLRTGKFVATGENKYDFPLRGYGFVFETDTRFRVNDFTHWSANNTNASVTKGGNYILRRTFTKYTRVYYDTVHDRGLIQEPNEGSSYKLYYFAEGVEPQLIDKKFSGGSMQPCRFSPDGKYAVGNDGTVVDMVKREVVTTKMGKKLIFYGEPVFSSDSRFVAFDSKIRSPKPDRTMTVYELSTQNLVREIAIPDSFVHDGGSTIVPLPDMQRAVIVRTPNNGVYYNMLGRAYLLAGGTITPLCYPGWKRERDEAEGKTSTAYNESANDATSNCPMEVAAMEADGKWDFTIGGRASVLYLSARPSGEVSGSYTYMNGSTKMKGKLNGKLSAKSENGTCVHTISGTFDETLFGGASGALNLRISADGKAISGNVGNSEWSGKKN